MVPWKSVCALLATAAPVYGVVHHQLAAVPQGWTKVRNAAADTKLTLSVALARQNMEQLESKLMALATPGHAEYGQWMDSHDIDNFFPPADPSEVDDWLRSHGVNNVQQQGGLLQLETDVATANKLLDTDFAWYQQGSTKRLRTTKYSVPNHLRHSIDLVSPTTFFGEPKGAHSFRGLQLPQTSNVSHSTQNSHSTDVDVSCHNFITPKCLRQMYQVGDFTPNPDSGARIGYGNFLNQTSSYKDLAQFEEKFGLPSENFSTTLINGGVNDQSPDAATGEANLDVQLIVALSHPLPVEAYITAGKPPVIPSLLEPNPEDIQNEPYLEYYEYLLSQPNSALPQVISNSYGEPEQTVPEGYARRVCNLIGMMGLRGITVLESSGDTGVGAACQANDGSKKPAFTPQFPGTCPFITAVGGTQAVSPEVAWDASSGGFSNYFPRAWYQENAVETYLHGHIDPETKKNYESYTNFQGRGFPDISAHSFDPPIAVIDKGNQIPSGGTSAACPIVASIIADLNSIRMGAGKPSLGFVNPFLYFAGQKVLHDITDGGSKGCDGTNLQTGQSVPGAVPIPYASWNATPGWDPVTGLGTPNFEKLRELAMSL